MKAINIDWDIDIDDAIDVLDDMSDEDIAETLNIQYDKYRKMTEEERYDFIYNTLRHSHRKMEDLMDLPFEVKIPHTLKNDEDISDWLTDTFGFCHRGFDLV